MVFVKEKIASQVANPNQVQIVAEDSYDVKSCKAAHALFLLDTSLQVSVETGVRVCATLCF